MHREVTSAQPSTDSALQADAALPVHPAADLFPLLEGEPYERFKADIAAHGLIEPIWLCDGQILDGRNRYRACRELGVEVRTRLYEGDSPVSHAWSLNGAKRHLSKSQLAAIAVEMLPALEAEAKKRQEVTRARPGERADQRSPDFGGALSVERDSSKHSGEAVVQAAKIVGIGKTNVWAAKSIKALDPQTFEQLKAGAVKNVEKARAQLSRRKIEEQQSNRHDGKKSRDQRSAEIRKLAGEGNKASQIAAAIGIGEQHVRKIARLENITLPDAAIGRTRKINARRVIEQTVTAVEGCALGLGTLDSSDFTCIGSVEAAEWAQALIEPLRALGRLRKQLLEIAQ